MSFRQHLPIRFGSDSVQPQENQSVSFAKQSPDTENAQNADEKPKKKWSDRLATGSLFSITALSAVMLFSPLISKKAAAILQDEARFLKQTPRMKKFITMASDHEKFKEKLKRITSIAGLIQLTTSYQVSLNTQQPSKLAGSLIWTLRSFLNIWGTGGFPNMLTFLGAIFWFAGERNDIENNLHPGNRREIDIRSLFPKDANGAPHFNAQEFKHTIHFIKDDVSYAMSGKPWKDATKSISGHPNWKEPQSYQTAFGSQFNALAGVGTLAMWLSTHKKGVFKADWIQKGSAAYKALNVTSKIGAILSIVAPSTPVALRAWESRDESDGLMALVGIPLATISRASVASPKIESLSGIGGLGAPFVMESKRRTGKKYRALVNYMKHLHQSALKDPSLNAQNVLNNLQTHPDQQEALAAQMGKVRVKYLMERLAEGVEKQKTGVSFADFLYPLTVASEESVHS